MAYSPIAFTAANYRDYKFNWLKAYEPGTTTPKAMGTDSTLSAFISKAQVNIDGFFVSAGGTLITPYVDGTYDLWLFPTEAEAEANDTSSALRLADAVTGAADLARDFVHNEATLDAAIAATNLVAGDAINVAERTATFGGGAMWDVVLSTSVTENGDNIVQCTGVPTLSLVRRDDWGNSIADLSQAYIFDTVADFKASLIEFPDGKTIHLNDRCADFTKITGTLVGDGVIVSTSVNQSISLITGGEIKASQFGVVADGAILDTSLMLEAIGRAKAEKINTITFTGTPLIDATLFLDAGMWLIGAGRGCELIPDAAGTFTQDYMVLINSTDGINATIEFPNLFAGACLNFNFRNESQTAGRKGVKGFGGCVFEDINGRYMSQLIVRPAGEYMDMVSIKRVFSEPVMGTDYQIELLGLGDAAVIEQVHCPYNAANPSNGTPKSISVGNSFGGVIRECIGGDIKIENSKLSIDNGHFERGQILLDTAQVTINSCNISAFDRVPIVALNSSIHESTVTLNNVEFAYMTGLFEWTGAHVQMDSSVNLVVNNSYEKYSSSGDVGICQLSAIRVQNDSAVEFSGWKDYAYEFSKNGRIGRGFKVNKEFSISPEGVSFNGMSSLGTAPTESWDIATGTYYYNVQLILDKGRLLGRTGINGEVSVALTSGSNGSQMIIDFGDRGDDGFLKIYRGTSANSYTEEVFIPLFNARIFYDNGDRINGIPWVARGAGGVNALNTAGEESFKLSGDHAEIRSAAPPTLGTWQVGDRADRISTTAGSNIGWSNTTTGFKAWGNIDP